MISRQVVDYFIVLGCTGVLLASIHGVTGDVAGAGLALVLVGTAAGTLAVALAADLRALWQDGDRS